MNRLTTDERATDIARRRSEDELGRCTPYLRILGSLVQLLSGMEEGLKLRAELPLQSDIAWMGTSRTGLATPSRMFSRPRKRLRIFRAMQSSVSNCASTRVSRGGCRSSFRRLRDCPLKVLQIGIEPVLWQPDIRITLEVCDLSSLPNFTSFSVEKKCIRSGMIPENDLIATGMR